MDHETNMKDPVKYMNIRIDTVQGETAFTGMLRNLLIEVQVFEDGYSVCHVNGRRTDLIDDMMSEISFPANTLNTF